MPNNKGANDQDKRRIRDQQAYWEAVSRGISGNLGIKTPEKNLVMVNSMPVELHKSEARARAELYSITNKIAPWTSSWDGQSGGDLFRSYQTFVSDLSPKPGKGASEATKKQMDGIGQKVSDLRDRTTYLLKEQVSVYKESQCLESHPNPNSLSCSVRLPGSDDLSDFLKKYKKSPAYQMKMTELHQEFSDDMDGLTDKYDALATKYYGSNYKQLAEAKRVVDLADPDNLESMHSDLSSDKLMLIDEGDGYTRKVPRFSHGELHLYRSWLKKMKQSSDNGEEPGFVVNFTRDEAKSALLETHTTSSFFVPTSLFFGITNNDSVGTKDTDVDRYNFNAQLGFQGLYRLPVSPSDSWYYKNLLEEYYSFYNSDLGSDSILYNKQLWGPEGIFALTVSSIIIGYAPFSKITMDHYHDTEAHRSWDTNTGFGIGPFTFENVHHSGRSDDVDTRETNEGFELRDTSGIAQVIAVTVDAPNYDFETKQIRQGDFS